MTGAHFNRDHSPLLLCATESWSRVLAKIALTLFGLLLCGAAVGLLFGGAFVIFTYQSYRFFIQNKFFSVPGWLAVVSALLLLPTGALAMCVPVKNSRHLQGIVMYLFLVLFCLEVSSVVMTQIYSAEVESQLKNKMGPFFHKYNWTAPNHRDTVYVDATHKKLKCCGISNYTDWMIMLPNHLQIGHGFAPESCCRETYLDCRGDLSQPEKLFKDGCHKKLEERFYFVKQYVTWCCVVIICLEILAAINNGILMKEQPFQDFRILDSAAFS
ncbi:tetraspanin-3 [Anolis carolinensis]|uniref:Tetraspanin n=1 Tax=Anolis carolinensis TaxID=28377 RepID=H9G5S2_ANOCA|nr:PREDICTED: tetraspanin-3 [Anolis carolinensis]|eukprot:XP_008115772.1 PREDICTED: tetraspanin-3 [Anolis carolinensis]